MIKESLHGPSHHPLVSVIVPVFNTKQYLDRFLESLTIQTFDDWECILVDDGSTDGSCSICREYAVKDSRFKVIRKKNGGVGSARNKGMEIAKGDWIYFSDSDDELYSDTIETLISLTSDDISLVMAGYDDIDFNGAQRNMPIPFFIETLNKEEAIRRLFTPKYYGYEGYLWCKLFKKKAINQHNLTFREDIAYNEDCLFIMNYLLLSEKPIRFTSKSVYRYCFNTTGAIGSSKTKFNKKFVSDFDVFIEMLTILRNVNYPKDIINAVKNRAISSYLSIMDMMKKYKADDSNIKKHLKNSLKSNIGYWYFYKRRTMCFFCRIISEH